MAGIFRRQRRQMMYPITAAAIALMLAMAGPVSRAADEAITPNIVFFGFQLINTSVEQTTQRETERLKMLDDLLREKLRKSGHFTIVPIPPGIQQQIAVGPEISNCNGCERDYAKRSGADWAAWGTVQKVSNLILNINLYMEDAETGKLEFVKSIDIRGNTDESWRHGLDYMLRHYLFKEP